MDGKNYADVDATIAMDHLILAATAEGLGTCWIGAFRPERLREVLGIPGDLEPVALTPLGYAASQPSPTPRKPLDEICEYI
jgi:nitroreductase